MASNKARVPNVYAYRGRYLLSTYVKRNDGIPKHTLPEMRRVLKNPETTSDLPVCIIGAGGAGLYTAMILESLGISYQIVDASTKERVGGRMFTYKFPNGGDYDYYDVGAMRFPDTPFMARTFDLARNRNLDVTLIPYIREMVDPPNTWLLYNNVRINNQDSSVTGDPFNVGGYVTDSDLETPQGVNQKVTQVLQPFRDLFRPPSSDEPPPEIGIAMANLFAETNNYSMRCYMLLITGMDPKDVNWCETIQEPTGWYDRALTQVIIENLAFVWPVTPLPGPEDPQDPNAGWYCFDGGSSTLPRAMFASLPQTAQDNTLFESPVTAISRDADNEVMNISIDGVQSSQQYSAVICTVPLPRLGLMDLTGANIHDKYAQWSAIRELQYGPAAKIGIKFSTAWWETLDQPIHGGQSYTDLPLRNIVYPSYPADAELEDRSKVLIVSYTRTEDAQRLGALIHSDGTAEPALIEVVFRDLAAVHGLDVDDIKQYYTDGDYFAWDWTHDPLTMGGYAFFSPGVYGDDDVYSAIILPAARGKLFFAGEAASACHAWVAGALDSAWRAVFQYLSLNNPDYLDEFYKLWGTNEYMDETDDDDLVQLNRTLAERHLVIALHKDGVRLEPYQNV